MASPLTNKQWETIQARLLAGEKGWRLAKEYGVSETAIRKRFGSRTKTIKTVANQLAAAELAFNELPTSSKIIVRELADELKDISSHLAKAARYGAMTSHRLSGIAHAQVDKIDDANPMESQEVLQGIAALTRLANDSSNIGLNLLNANKKAVEDNKPADGIKAIRIIKASA